MESKDQDPHDPLRMIDWPAQAEEALPPAAAPVPAAFRERRRRPRLDPASLRTPSEELREIAFENVSATPLPETSESSSDLAWAEFDAAQAQVDLPT